MKEIITYIAEDGRVFEGINAKANCQAYERRNKDSYLKEIIEGFKKIATEIKVPVATWWYGDSAKAWKVTLNSKEEYQTLLDYLYVKGKVWDGHNRIMEEPKQYPYTTIIGRGEEWAYEYKIEEYKKDLQKMLEDINN